MTFVPTSFIDCGTAGQVARYCKIMRCHKGESLKQISDHFEVLNVPLKGFQFGLR